MASDLEVQRGRFAPLSTVGCFYFLGEQHYDTVTQFAAPINTLPIFGQQEEPQDTHW